MAKIVVKIVTDGANVSGGLANSQMLRPFKADVVKDTDYVGQISGGVLPITQAEYDATVA
jgi:hypothetical protein